MCGRKKKVLASEMEGKATFAVERKARQYGLTCRVGKLGDALSLADDARVESVGYQRAQFHASSARVLK